MFLQNHKIFHGEYPNKIRKWYKDQGEERILMSIRYVPEIEGKDFFDLSSLIVELVGYLPAVMNEGKEGFEFALHDGGGMPFLAYAHAIEGEKPFIISKEEEHYPECPQYMDKEAVVSAFEINILDALQQAQMHLMEEEGFSKRLYLDLVAAGVEGVHTEEQNCSIVSIKERDCSNDAPTWRATIAYGNGKRAEVCLYPEECIPSFMKADGCPFQEGEYGAPMVWHPAADVYVSKTLEPKRIAMQIKDHPSYPDTFKMFQDFTCKLMEHGVSKRQIMEVYNTVGGSSIQREPNRAQITL